MAPPSNAVMAELPRKQPVPDASERGAPWAELEQPVLAREGSGLRQGARECRALRGAASGADGLERGRQ